MNDEHLLEPSLMRLQLGWGRVFVVRQTSVEAWVEGENDPVAEGDEGERADVELRATRLEKRT